MSDTAALIDDIQSLPPDLAAEVQDFVGYLKYKSRKNAAAVPGAGKPAGDAASVNSSVRDITSEETCLLAKQVIEEHRPAFIELAK